MCGLDYLKQAGPPRPRLEHPDVWLWSALRRPHRTARDGLKIRLGRARRSIQATPPREVFGKQIDTSGVTGGIVVTVKL